MKNIFDYIGYRIFEYFNQKDKTLSISKTINFLALLQGSLIVPLFILINLFTRVDPQIFGLDNRIKYYIGILLALILILVNHYIFKKKLNSEGLKVLHEKYHKEKYAFSVWFIFLAPAFFVFICPLIYGILNGTIYFPFLMK
jgi:hypothetical protein